jgi:hypothetical protein
LRSPFGKHKCPSCERHSKLSTGLLYWALYLPLVAFSPAIAVVVTALIYAFVAPQHAHERFISFFGTWWAYLPLVGAVVIFFPIDRIVDERLRRLRATTDAQNAV